MDTMNVNLVLAGGAALALGAAVMGSVAQMVRLALAGLAGVVLFASVASSGSGGISGTLTGWYRDATGGWTEQACSEQPVACLQARQTKLQQAQGVIEVGVNTVRGQVDRVAAMIRERENVLGQNELLLKEGKRLLQLPADPSLPVQFVGRSYPNRETLTTQVSLLFNEHESLQKLVTQARSQHDALRSRLDDLLISRGEVRSALTLMPARIELARANGVIGELKDTFASIDGVLSGTEKQMATLGASVATTEELMKSAQAGAAQSRDDSKFKAFLTAP
jgi:hypothetical protein